MSLFFCSFLEEFQINSTNFLSGKTTISDHVATLISETLHIQVLTFSIDDFYLSHKDQLNLSLSHPGNKLLEYRGLPGTHDINLCHSTFNALISSNQTLNQIKIPRYDKSWHNGRGDRVPFSQWTTVIPPVDLIIFEGWLLGFKPLSQSKLYAAYTLSKSFIKKHSFEHLQMINKFLADYEQKWYCFLDAFAHIDVKDISYVYDWRLQQEHSMKEKGMDGMSDGQVHDFVDRYMPAYELYLEGLRHGCFFCGRESCEQHLGRHLRLLLNQERDIVWEGIVGIERNSKSLSFNIK